MSLAELGCAQNPDGTLKEAHEINFTYSQSASPINLSALPVPVTANKLPSALKDGDQQAPAHGKVPKKRGRKPKTVMNSRRPITAALPVMKQRNPLTFQDRIDIAEFMGGEGLGWKQREIAEHFRKKLNLPKLNQSIISVIKTNRDAILAMKGKPPSELSFKRVRRIRYPNLEEALRTWHLQAESQITVSPHMLIEKGRQLAMKLGISDNDLKFSPGWLDSYRQRYGYRVYRFHGEAGSCLPTNIAAARAHMAEILKGYKPECIYNMDETGLYYRMPPDKGLATKCQSGVKADKTRFTLGFTANADSSDKRQPFFIAKARKPQCFKRKEGRALGFEYYWNKSAWMMGSVCQAFVFSFLIIQIHANINHQVSRRI